MYDRSAANSGRHVAGGHDGLSADSSKFDFAVLQGSRSDIDINEMQKFFEIILLPYMSKADTDPVFLDVEYLLPPVFLLLAVEAVHNAKFGARNSRPHGSLQGGLTVVDVGAYAGHFGFASLSLWDAIMETGPRWPSVGLPSHVAPRRAPIYVSPPHVVAVEPAHDLCAALQEPTWNTTRTLREGSFRIGPRPTGSLSAVCSAALDVSGASVLYCPGRETASLGFNAQQDLLTGFQEPCNRSQEARIITLVELAAEHQIQDITLLKVDAEGSDPLVFYGASELFAARRIRFVLFEVGYQWRERAEAIGRHRTSRYETAIETQLGRVLEFLWSRSEHTCFLIGPEVLVPLLPPWSIGPYAQHEQSFNVFCAQRHDPVLPGIIRLYTVTPRATQFALAAVPPASVLEPRCWACYDLEMADVKLRRLKLEADEYFTVVHRRLLRKGWFLPHFLFVHARSLQTSGDVDAALRVYDTMQGAWPGDFEARREAHRLSSGQTKLLLRNGNCAVKNLKWLSLMNRTTVSDLIVSSVHLARIHMRPGSGVAFGASHSCAAERWHRVAANLGDPGAALMAGLSAQLGLCSATMTAEGAWEALIWYLMAIRHADSNANGMEPADDKYIAQYANVMIDLLERVHGTDLRST